MVDNCLVIGEIRVVVMVMLYRSGRRLGSRIEFIILFRIILMIG